MVATVLRLRYRILGNTLVGRPWRIIGFCFGMLGALWAVGLVALGVVLANLFGDLAITRTVAVFGGSALLVGWVVGPVLVAGLDQSVDASRLSLFPLTVRQVMTVLTAAGLTGIPGIATGLAMLIAVGLWVQWPLAAVAALPCMLLAWLTCVVASQLMATLSGGTGRRSQEIVGTIALIAIILIGPALSAVTVFANASTDLAARFRQIGDVLAWTPIGAAWAVPGDVAAEEWGLALGRFALAIVTLAVLWALWARALDVAITSPPRRAARAVSAGQIGLFGVMSTGPVGATWARSLTAWLKDPRYLRQLIAVPILPVVFAVASGADGLMFVTSPVVVALILAFAGYTDISYDGTAFGTVLATGIPGRADRAGRALAMACVSVPIVLVLAVAVAAVSGTYDLLPAVLGASLGLLLTGMGVTAVSSALLTTPVPAPGDSPFKSVPGQTFLSGVMVFVVLAACIVTASPPLVLALTSVIVGSAPLGWLALAVAVGYGAVITIVGVVIGGRLFDRRGPELLASIKAFPTS